MYTATVKECEQALRKMPAFILFTSNQLMWMVKDFSEKKIYVTQETIQKTLEKMVNAKNPYLFKFPEEDLYWKDAVAFRERFPQVV